MANESSTKPTYSELAKRLWKECVNLGVPNANYAGFDCDKAEEILEEEFAKLSRHQEGYLRDELSKRDKGLFKKRERIRELESDLARVRGLLQRAAVLLDDLWRTDTERKQVDAWLAESQLPSKSEPSAETGGEKQAICECGHPRDEHALVSGACANAVNLGSGKPLEWCKCKSFTVALAESSLSSQTEGKA